MATKTIILRPHRYWDNINNAAGINVEWTFYPADTPHDDISLLVSEEVADDDATYVSVPTTGNCSDGFGFATADLDIIPISIRILARMRCQNTAVVMKYDICAEPVDGASHGTTICSGISTEALSATYTTHSCNIPSEYVSTIWDYMCSTAVYVCLGPTNSSGSGKSASNTIITQLYLEVDYDDGTGIPDTPEAVMYQKIGDAWTPVYGTVYKKVNGIWQLNTLDHLTTEDKIIIEGV